MAYNTKLEEKIEAEVKQWKGMEKKRLFGGVCWMLKGNMAFGIYKDFLIVRMEREQGEKSLKLANVEPFAITGKPMSGWVMVNDAGWKGRAGLIKWIGIGKEYAQSLPVKEKKVRKKKILKEYRA